MEEWRNYIKENRAIFDDQEPGEGHCKRFEERLDSFARNNKHKRTLGIKPVKVFSIAASVIVFVYIGIQFFLPSKDAGEGLLVGQSPANEFITTNNFYKEQMKEQIASIQCKLSATDRQNRSQLEEDLQSILDENNRFTLKIQNIENEELALFYLVKYYRTNLRTLHFINNKLGKYVEC
ncbi:MAG: hypothetical protein LBP83_06480 [Dysgonamonadaceae bacterium]|jgi:hypothetical protein|nr:hypothetical protein [Dysgonamonadaceae bacterium]